MSRLHLENRAQVTVLGNMQATSDTSLGPAYDAVVPMVNPKDNDNILYDAAIVMRGLLTMGTSIVPNNTLKGVMGTGRDASGVLRSISPKAQGLIYNRSYLKNISGG